MHKGNMNKLFETVMFSNPLHDEARFRKIIDEAISSGFVQTHEAYATETAAQKQSRMKKAKKELKEFEKAKNHSEAMESLQALMLNCRKGPGATTFLDDLEAKYGGSKKRKATSEPTEADFAATAARARRAPVPSAAKVVEDKEEEEEEDDDDDDDDEEEAKAKGKKKAPARKGRGRKKNAN